jgi:hypothetical protein
MTDMQGPRPRRYLGGPIVLAILLLLPSQLYAYKIKEFKPKPAKEYAAFQDFQNIVLAASPRLTEEGVMELFDTKKLLERKIMPVVLVVENNNDFAIRLHESEIYLVNADGTRARAIPFPEVLMKISGKRGAVSGTTPRPDVILRQIGDKKMVEDFEHKSFGEKLVAPHDSDYGVLFFPVPEDGSLVGSRLYIPEVYNITKDEPLMFFEFELAKGK